MNKIDTELQDKFQSSLNLDDAHVQVWTRQLDATHPLALRLERARQAIASDGAAFASAWDVWEKVDELEVERTNVKSWLTHSRQSKAEKMSELERIDAEIAALIGDKPAQTAATPAPVLAVEPASDGPAPLTTGNIAYCFDGLHWNESEWKKPLGDKPKWLSKCVAIPGQQGVSETRWSPVLIGAELVRQGHVKARSMRSKFQTVELLKPWLDEWKTYEADNLDTQ